MIKITSFDKTAALEFDFTPLIREEFDESDSAYEKWVPFILRVCVPGWSVSIPRKCGLP